MLQSTTTSSNTRPTLEDVDGVPAAGSAAPNSHCVPRSTHTPSSKTLEILVCGASLRSGAPGRSVYGLQHLSGTQEFVCPLERESISSLVIFTNAGSTSIASLAEIDRSGLHVKIATALIITAACALNAAHSRRVNVDLSLQQPSVITRAPAPQVLKSRTHRLCMYFTATSGSFRCEFAGHKSLAKSTELYTHASSI